MPGHRRRAPPAAEDELGEQARAAVTEAVDDVDEKVLSDLLSRLEYVGGDAEDGPLYERLRRGARRRGAPVFYLATPPSMFLEVAEELAGAGLADNARLVVEKPFGSDLASARELNERLTAIFPEDQLYRIDHFLGKEPVQDIIYLRFANALFEPVWSREDVDSIQITLAEDFGVEGRGSFYDKVGAIRDVVQNHLLQVLALAAMEPPSGGDDAIPRRRLDVFRSMPGVDPDNAVRGQYEGYREIEGVTPKSDTETFVALRLEIENWRWAGIPIFIRAGKALPVAATEVVVRLQRVPQLRWGSIPASNARQRRHRPPRRPKRRGDDRHPREDSGQGGLAAGLARPRLRGGARRAAGALRAPARRRLARRQHALPALGGHRGDVAHRAAAARLPAAARALRQGDLGPCERRPPRRAERRLARPHQALLDPLDRFLASDQHFGDELRGEEAMLDDPGDLGQSVSERSGVVHRPDPVRQDASVGRRGSVAKPGLAEPLERRGEPERDELERDRRSQPVDELVRGDDHDEAIGCRRDDLLPRVGAAATLHEPGVGRELVGPVDGDVESSEAAVECDELEPDGARSSLGLRRRGDAAQVEVAGSERRKEVRDGRSGAEADRHPVFDQLCGCLGGQPLLALDVGAHVGATLRRLPFHRMGWSDWAGAVEVEPSIYAADFSRLGDQLGALVEAGARAFHFDAGDGHFIPEITIGPVVLASISPLVHAWGAVLDCHLMVERPERHFESVAEAGGDSVTFHVEACSDPSGAIAQARSLGLGVGIAFSPDTPVEEAVAAAGGADLVLCMSIHPGYSGQAFMSEAAGRIERLRGLLPEGTRVQVDGGINAETIGTARQAGADLLVAGSAIFWHDDPAGAYTTLTEAIAEHRG